jgi:hypothetical protein
MEELFYHLENSPSPACASLIAALSIGGRYSTLTLGTFLEKAEHLLAGNWIADWFNLSSSREYENTPIRFETKMPRGAWVVDVDLSQCLQGFWMIFTPVIIN